MLTLDLNTKKLQAYLAGAMATANPVYFITYVDVTTTTYTPTEGHGSLNGTAKVDLTPVSGVGHQLQVKYLSIYNKDTAAITLSICVDLSATPTDITRAVLAVNETFEYTDGKGFCVRDANGNVKCNVSPGILAVAASGGTVTSGQLSFDNANGVSFGINGQTITGSIANVTGSMSVFEAPHAELNLNAAATNSAAINLSLQRFYVPAQIAVTQIDLLANLTVAGSTANSTTLNVAIYTITQSTINMASSSAFNLSFNSAASGGAAGYNSFSGTRWRSHPIAGATWVLAPGEYYLGLINSVQGPAGTTGSMSFYGQSSVSLVSNMVIGAASATSLPYWAPYGMFNAATGGFPAAITLGSFQAFSTAAMRQPYFILRGTF